MDLNSIRKELKPIYEESKKARRESYILFAITGLICVLLALTFASTFKMFPVFAAIIVVIAVVFYFNAKLAPRINNYGNVVREKVYPLVFSQHFENVVYDHNDGITRDLVETYAVIDTGQDYDTEDYLSGSYKGVNFSRADIDTSTTTTHSNGETTTTTTTVYFKGQVYKFDFHKNVNAYVRVREKGGFFSSSFSKGDNVFNSFKFKLEDKEFNKNFHAVTNDEQFAFYVFTPQFMAKVDKLSSLTSGNIGIVIYQDTLYLACYSKENSLEFNDNREIDQEMIRNLESEIEIIKVVIDELGLDSDLFKERN